MTFPACARARAALLVLLAVSSLTLAAKSAEAPFYPDKMNLLVWRGEQGLEHAISNPQEWERRRAHILANMQAVMGPLPGPEQRVPLDVQVISTEELPGLVRKKITYAAAKEYRVPA